MGLSGTAKILKTTLATIEGGVLLREKNTHKHKKTGGEASGILFNLTHNTKNRSDWLDVGWQICVFIYSANEFRMTMCLCVYVDSRTEIVWNWSYVEWEERSLKWCPPFTWVCVCVPPNELQHKKQSRNITPLHKFNTTYTYTRPMHGTNENTHTRAQNTHTQPLTPVALRLSSWSSFFCCCCSPSSTTNAFGFMMMMMAGVSDSARERELAAAGGTREQ